MLPAPIPKGAGLTDPDTMSHTLASLSRFVDRRQSLVYPAPAVIVLFLIVVLPIAFNLYLAFTKWTVGWASRASSAWTTSSSWSPMSASGTGSR